MVATDACTAIAGVGRAGQRAWETLTGAQERGTIRMFARWCNDRPHHRLLWMQKQWRKRNGRGRRGVT